MNKVSLEHQGVALEPSAAGAVLTIDLQAVRENYRRLRAKAGAARCAGVVKADGYGLGAVPVALALVAEGCDTFFVAHVGEGISLREVIGPKPTIYVLNGIPPGAERDATGSNLRAVINSLDQLSAWSKTARDIDRKLAAAVQVDSGMSRLGMAASEVMAATADPQAFAGIEVALVMSHLACADEPAHPANEAQRAEFDRLRAVLPPAPASLANSSGIFLGDDFHHQLARPGAALYGINPTPGHDNPMLPVVRLQAQVIQTRSVPSGSGIGYGHTVVTRDTTALATIALGYADGWRRRAAASAYFDGVRLPFIGRVSMDSIILDISDLPEGRLRPGDMVEMIGPSQMLDEVAGFSGTIAYEVLTSLGHRFHRRYIGGA
jgi:alanine racemase